MKNLLLIFAAIALMGCSKGGDDNGIGAPSDSVTINGVTWATRNVANSGVFAETPEAFGNYYTFDQAQTACPSGWRLPSEPELSVLAGAESKWVALNGVIGREFGSGKNTTIFLPAAGYVFSETDNSVSFVGEEGHYLSSKPTIWGGGYHLSIESDGAEVESDAWGYKQNVRCVKM